MIAAHLIVHPRLRATPEHSRCHSGQRGELGAHQRLFSTVIPGTSQEYIRFNSDDTLRLFETFATLETAQQFRDLSAWYHIVVAVDSTQATASDRVKLYVNGAQVTQWEATTYPSLNATCQLNTTVSHQLGSGTVEYYDGYLADIHFVDGLALAPTEFGETRSSDGVWVSKYTGSHTTTGSTMRNSSGYNNSNTSLPTYSDQDNNTGNSVYQMENAFDGNSSTYANMTYANGKWTRADFFSQGILMSRELTLAGMERVMLVTTEA